jgi:hypothetical protein
MTADPTPELTGTFRGLDYRNDAQLAYRKSATPSFPFTYGRGGEVTGGAVLDAIAAVAPLLLAEGARAEREAIRKTLVEGDPGRLEQAFRAVVYDDEAADCAGIVADLLDAEQP